MFINRTNGFSQVPVHFRVTNIKRDIIVVNDPGEDGVLWEVVVRAVGDNIDEVEILDVGDLAIGPHVDDIAEL